MHQQNNSCRSRLITKEQRLVSLLASRGWIWIGIGANTFKENLQEAINTLAPEKTFKPRKHAPSWLNAELRLLISKRDATNRRYSRIWLRQLLNELIDLANTCEEKCEVARCACTYDRISDTLDSGKNFWKELRNLGLIPKASDVLHGFMPDELNDHFSSIPISPTEDVSASLDILATS